MKILNIGILAHVDAGKTTLTEAILHNVGVTKERGSVDKGSTITDSLDVEKKRGITVKAAAVSFQRHGVKVNLVDTPGHADFISEVEHSLQILDGAILVVSAVEGVQAQTKVLFQTLEENNIPTIVFINKIDRIGANVERVVKQISSHLSKNLCTINHAFYEGTKQSYIKELSLKNRIEQIALEREKFFLRYLTKEIIKEQEFLNELTTLTQLKKIYPLFVGSAYKNIGVNELIYNFTSLLLPDDLKSIVNNPLSALVFKITFDEKGRREVLVRIFEGSILLRQEIKCSRDGEEFSVKIKRMAKLVDGNKTSTKEAFPGEMIILNVEELAVGDVIGVRPKKIKRFVYNKPTMEVKIKPKHTEDDNKLYEALKRLTVEDPFLNYSHIPHTQDHLIQIFGQVQQEILYERLASDFGIPVTFALPEVLCLEKPIYEGHYIELMKNKHNPFLATIGLKVKPGLRDSGIKYLVESPYGNLPVSFHTAIHETVLEVLNEGLMGWPVTDIEVTLTNTGYASAVSTAADFRNLTPIVLMKALNIARTKVFEPLNSFELRIPLEFLSKVTSLLYRLSTTVHSPNITDHFAELKGIVAVRKSDLLKKELQTITSGEAFITYKPCGYTEMKKDFLRKKRLTINPLNESEYLLNIRSIL
ncbi:GTP-binding protein [Alkalicoccobacillus gibsonii]|uniref:GTP-binding protein n=1 Tax=Alkalicoccobacillus gibsonii TaxID=79881 RepID=UPI003F7BAA83